MQLNELTDAWFQKKQKQIELADWRYREKIEHTPAYTYMLIKETVIELVKRYQYSRYIDRADQKIVQDYKNYGQEKMFDDEDKLVASVKGYRYAKYLFGDNIKALVIRCLKAVHELRPSSMSKRLAPYAEKIIDHPQSFQEIVQDLKDLITAMNSMFYVNA